MCTIKYTHPLKQLHSISQPLPIHPPDRCGGRGAKVSRAAVRRQVNGASILHLGCRNKRYSNVLPSNQSCPKISNQ